MRCLVTGAAGFIGSRLSARLVADGHSVVGLDDLSIGSQDNLVDVSEADFVVGDLRDEDTVREVAQGCEVIYHLGAVRSVPRSIAYPALTTDVNVRGTLNVLIAAHARDFTYVEDAVEGSVLAGHASQEAWGRVFNIGGGRTPTSVNRLLEKIADLTETTPEPLHEPPREGDVRLTQADLSLAESVLGYRPSVCCIDEGLEQSVTWFARHLAPQVGTRA